MPTPGQLTLDPQVRGDNWLGIPNIGPVTIDGVQPAQPAVAATMTFRRMLTSLVYGYTLRNSPGAGEGTIQIVNADYWIFKVPAQLLPLQDGPWFWDFQITPQGGLPVTYLQGTVLILPDQTR